MPRTITLDELAGLRSIGSPEWSPDGSRVASVVGATDLEANKGTSAIWVWDRATRRSRALTSGRHSDSRPRWSPDGQHIAFVSNRADKTHLWLVPVDGGEPEPLTDGESACGVLLGDGFFGAHEWSPDGTRIAVVAQRKSAWRSTEEEWSDVTVVGRVPGEGYADVHSACVFVLDVPTRQVRVITDDEFWSGDCQWSPDGRWIAYTSNHTGEEEAVTASINKPYDIWVVSARGGRARRLTRSSGPDFGPRWSPDGRHIAYTTIPRCGSHRDMVNLAVVPAKGGRARVLCDHHAVPMHRAPHVPILGALPRRPWSPDGKTLTYATNRGLDGVVVRVDVRTGRGRVISGRARTVSTPSLSPDGRHVTAVGTTATRPAEIWVGRSDGTGWRAVTHLSGLPRGVALSRVQVVRWRSPDGLRVEGLYWAPTWGRGARRPLIVVPHGGPHGQINHGFNVRTQFLCAQGYGVFEPNFRGSTGYGQAFVDADRCDLGGGDFQDILSGVDHLVKTGKADPGRLAMVGLSYGGFMTTWAVGHTDRFKAAVAVCAVTDMESMFGTTDIPSWVEWEMGGLIWEVAQRAREHSPVHDAHHATTPTLVLHGQSDQRVPIGQGTEFYSRLKRAGVETQMVVYGGAGHSFSKPRQVRDSWLRIVHWLARFIPGVRKPPAWPKAAR